MIAARISAAGLLMLAAVMARAQESKVEVALRQTHMLVERCRTADPVFARRSASVYADWQRRHREALAALAGRRGYQEQLRQFLSEGGFEPGLYCNDALIAYLAETARPREPAFATPESAWAAFVAALRGPDRAAAVNCLTGRAAAVWNQNLHKLGDEQLRAMGAGFKELKMDWGDAEMKTAFVIRHDGAAGSVTFVNQYGNWKIADM